MVTLTMSTGRIVVEHQGVDDSVHYNTLGLGIGEVCEYYFDPANALDSRRSAGVEN